MHSQQVGGPLAGPGRQPVGPGSRERPARRTAGLRGRARMRSRKEADGRFHRPGLGGERGSRAYCLGPGAGARGPRPGFGCDPGSSRLAFPAADGPVQAKAFRPGRIGPRTSAGQLPGLAGTVSRPPAQVPVRKTGLPAPPTFPASTRVVPVSNGKTFLCRCGHHAIACRGPISSSSTIHAGIHRKCPAIRISRPSFAGVYSQSYPPTSADVRA
jgi:hypothetical protein